MVLSFQSAWLAALALIPAGAPLGPVQRVSDDAIELRARKIAAEEMRRDDVDSLVVVIAFGQDLYYARGWGLLDSDAHAALETVFGVGSLTEQLVTVGILRLVDAKQLALEDELSDHLEDTAWAGVEIHHLLSGTSGLPDYEDLGVSFEEAGLDGVLERLRAEPLESDPGSCHTYSRSNILLLGHLLEQKTGRKLDDLFEEIVFEAVGMETTAFRDDRPQSRATARTSQEVAGQLELRLGGPQPFGAERLCSTAWDLVLWQRALADRDLLGERLSKRMTAPARLADGSPTRSGFGFNLAPLDGHDAVSYGGGMAGSRFHVAYYPPFDMTVVVLASGDSAALERVERRIARAVFDLPEPELQDRPLTDDERGRYVGGYHIGCNHVDVRLLGEHLVIESVDRPTLLLLYQGQHVFVARDDPDIRLTFEVVDDLATSFALEERGSRSIAVRFD